ncbi:MAG TPA: TonB family protein [Pyrinomonadaceae bacterium]|nr:TonB family protein [Pyrinomonadaceae bacterium]
MKSFAVVLILLGAAIAASAQSAIDWEILRSDADAFSVQMPKGSASQTTKEPYHKFELNVTTYLSQPNVTPVFAIVSMSGIKSNPAMYSEAERLNSYVDAFRTIFPGKIRGKEAVAKLTLVGDKVLSGNAGREYRMTVGDLTGVVRAYVTRKRFYAIAFLSNKKADQIQEQFLSSFTIPEKVATPVTAAVTPPPAQTEAGGNQQAAAANNGDAPVEGEAPAATPAAAGEGENASQSPKKRAPISGGVLNGKALSLPAPDFPAAAKAANTYGTVVVRVTIDEQGNVISATAVSGPPLLQQASVNAALLAHFSPTLLMGEPVQVVGVITYNFARN